MGQRVGGKLRLKVKFDVTDESKVFSMLELERIFNVHCIVRIINWTFYKCRSPRKNPAETGSLVPSEFRCDRRHPNVFPSSTTFIVITHIYIEKESQSWVLD